MSGESNNANVRISNELKRGNDRRGVSNRSSHKRNHMRRRVNSAKFKNVQQQSFSRQQVLRSQMLLQEEAGFLEAEDGEETCKITQEEIRKEVDLLSATKSFDLNLHQFGPYKLDYTKNGRHLVIGGRRGHLAAFDWVTKKLLCEINAMEEVHDVVWLHQETMFAAAQKDWVYIYDNQGIELHCIKSLHRILNMEFLPYHYLLVTASDRGFLNWLDVSVGKIISGIPTHYGRLDVMCQNPHNAVTLLGHARGAVTMWSPTVKDPLATMLCHTQPIRGVAVDPTGRYLATTATDRSLKIWDVRTYRCLQHYRIPGGASKVTFSQKGLLALSIGNVVQVYRDCCTTSVSSPYMCHNAGRTVSDLSFCPFEDALGVGHEIGFSSIVIPGAGEPNFDALERNPFQTKSQRRESEVKSLLEKIAPEMIALDPYKINHIYKPGLNVKDGRALENQKLQFKARIKESGVSFQSRRAARDEETRKLVRRVNKQMEWKKQSDDGVPASSDVLDRFRAKPS